MKKTVQRRCIYIIVLLIVFITMWPNIQRACQAQTLNEPQATSAAVGGQMAIAHFPGVMGGGFSNLIGPDLSLSLGFNSLAAPLLSSPIPGFSQSSGRYFLGGGTYLPNLSGTSLSIGGGSFMNFGNPVGALGLGITPPLYGGGVVNNIALPIELSQFSPSFNYPKNINSLFGFYSPAFDTSRPTYFLGGRQYPLFQTGGYSSSPYGTFPSGMWGGMTQWGGYSYGGGYPSFNMMGNYPTYTPSYNIPYTSSYTTPYSSFYTAPYTATSYSGSYYDRFAHGATPTDSLPYFDLSYSISPISSIIFGLIQGTVTIKGGEPLVGADIIIIPQFGIVRKPITGANGFYEAGLFGGLCTVEVHDPLDDSILRTQSVYVNKGTSRLDFPDLEPKGVLKGKVTHATNTDIPLKEVEITVSLEDQGLFTPSPLLRSKTNSEGGYLFILPAGNYIVTATCVIDDNYEINQSIKVKINYAKYTDQDLELSLPLFRGKVEDVNGKSIEDASVDIDPEPPFDSDIKTDSGGMFEVPLPIKTHTFVITADGYKKKTKSFSIPSQGLVEHTFELEEVDNIKPVILSPQKNANIKIEAGQELSLSVSANDSDGPNDLSYTIEGPASWNPTIYSTTYSYMTTLSDLGEHPITITVSDGEDSATRDITVTVFYSLFLKLEQGINLICYPDASNDSGGILLSILGNPAQVESILRYAPAQGKYQKIGYDNNGTITNPNKFMISREEGYLVYAKESIIVNLEITGGDLTSCSYNLHQGNNLIGIPIILSEEYSAYDLLLELKKENVESIYRYNGKTGGYEYACWIADSPVGTDFPIRMGEGYFIQMKNEKQLSLPLSSLDQYRLR